MAHIEDIEISRKTSIFSDKVEFRKKSLGPISEEPKDRFFIALCGCATLGFMNIMPLVFFSTAAGYWMYKFRDPNVDSDTTIGSDRTLLQSYYQPCSIIATTGPSLIFTSLLTVYGHKSSAMLRTIWALVGLKVLFIVFTLFTQINTDSWQTGFFILTMFLLVCNSALTTVLQISSLILVAKLSPKYMFFFLVGQNGTLLTTILQIVSLSVTDNPPTSGLIYFMVGSVLTAITLGLLILARRSEVFKHFDVEDTKGEKSESVNWEDVKRLSKMIWPCLVLVMSFIFLLSCTHPSLTTLVVSQYEADKTAWTTKYFTPVTVFLTLEVGALLGRIISKPFSITQSNKWFWVSFAILRFSFIVPFYVFCDAEPRNLPVVFDKDWEFITFNIFVGISNGFFINVAFMSIQTLLPDKHEVGFKLMSIILAVTSAVTAGNGILMVNLLKV